MLIGTTLTTPELDGKSSLIKGWLVIKGWLEGVVKILSALSGALIAGLVGVSSASAVTFTSYIIDPGLLPNQSWSGTLGQDFTANVGITIDSFGVWVPGGSLTPLTISIYNENTQALLISQTFPAPVPGVGTGNNVLFGAPVNFFLAPGNYVLAGDGFVAPGLFNTQGGGLAGTLDSGGGALGFGGWRFAYSANVFPDQTVANCCGPDSPFRYAAMTFTATAAVPEPSTWAMMILGFAGVGFMAYRRKPALMAA
jgi:hypothetical protein